MTNRLSRAYDGGAKGTPMQGWEGAGSSDANSEVEANIRTLTDRSEDLIRNNGYATNAQRIWTEGLIGEGMTGEIKAVGGKKERLVKERTELWEAWAQDPRECDYHGIHDFNGLQALICDAWFSGGNTVIVRRPALDNKTAPLRIQVIEGALIDVEKTGTTENGGSIVNGVQFSASGRFQGIWLLDRHPGSSRIFGISLLNSTSNFFRAEDIIHVFSARRPGQVLGVPRLSNTILTMKDADNWEYAKLKQALVASCFGVLVSGEDTTGIDTGNPNIKEAPMIDRIEPAMIEYIGLDREVNVLNPPNSDTGNDFNKMLAHKMAAAIGVTYEDLTTDLSEVSFISGRMGRIRQNKMLKRERKTVFIPMCLDRIYLWFEMAAIISGGMMGRTKMQWTAPVPELTDPKSEGDALNNDVRRGFISDQDAIRARGGNPDKIIESKQEWNQRLDENAIILDSDPRNISGAGQLQGQGDGSTTAMTDEQRAAHESGKKWFGKVGTRLYQFQKDKKPVLLGEMPDSA